MKKIIIILFFTTLYIPLQAQDKEGYSTKSVDFSFNVFKEWFSLEPGFELAKNKHSYVFSIRYSSFYQTQGINYDTGILITYRKMFRDPAKKFQPLIQTSLYLVALKDYGINYGMVDGRAYGFNIFAGGGFNHKLSRKISIGLSANLGWGRAWGKVDPEFVKLYHHPLNHENFFIARPLINLRYKLK